MVRIPDIHIILDGGGYTKTEKNKAERVKIGEISRLVHDEKTVRRLSF